MATTCTASGTIMKGDAVCVTGYDAGNSRPTVSRASAANLATSKTVFGVAEANSGGGTVAVRVAGAVAEDDITSLGAGDSRIIATDINNVSGLEEDQCRLIRVDRPDGSEHVVGTCDEVGNLALQPRASHETSSMHVANICAYGAVASEVGAADPFDCTAALLAAIAAATTADSSTSRHGVVFVPPCPPNFEYYVAGQAQDNFPSPHIEVSRTVRILGVSTGDSLQGGSRIKFGPLCAGFRFVSSQGSSDGGDATGARIEGLSIFCTQLDDTDIVRGWQSNHAYTKGDLIRPHRFHNLYYECLKDGTSYGPTPAIGDCTRYATNAIPEAGNRWMPARTYAVDDTIYPNVPCGRLFICTAAGTTIGDVFSGGTDKDGEPMAEGLPAAGQQANVGEPAWFTNYDSPRTTVWPLIEEFAPQLGGAGPQWAPVEDPKTISDASNDPTIVVTSVGHGYADGTLVVIRGVGGNTAANGDRKVANATADTFELNDLFGGPVAGNGAYTAGGEAVEVSDPEPIWEHDNPGSVCLAKDYVTTHVYSYGCHVFGKDGGGDVRYDVIFVGFTAAPGTTGTSGGAQPGAFETAMPGDGVIHDNDIDWYPIEPLGVVPDGDTFWAARFAGAYMVHAPSCTIATPFIEGAPTAAIGVFSHVISAGGGQSFFGDFTRVRGPGNIRDNGVAIYLKGGDTNACVFSDLLMTGGVGADYWLDPADHIVYDRSFLGNAYVNCIVQACSGYAFAMLGQSASGTMVNTYLEGVGRKSPLRGNTQVLGGSAVFFRLDQIDKNSDGTGGPSLFNDQANNLRTISHSDTTPGMSITAALKGNRDSALHFFATNDLSLGTGDDPNGYQFTYGSPVGADGFWSFVHANNLDAFHVSGASADVGPGALWLQRGHFLGVLRNHYHFADDSSSRDSLITNLARRHGDIVDRSERAMVGQYYHRVNVNSTGGSYGFPWEAGHTYSVGDIRVPTAQNITQSRRAFQVTDIGDPPHQSGGTEPTWTDTLDDEVPDGDITWTCIEGADFRFASLIEDGAVGRRIQPVMVWADSGDTDERYVQPDVRVRSRRLQAQTTTDDAFQVIDDGLALGSDTEDFTLPEDATTVVEVTLLVKDTGNLLSAGSIKLVGTYFRDGAGDAVNIPTDDNVSKLTTALAGVSADLFINGGAVEVRVSPGAALALDWWIVRTQTEGSIPPPPP